MIFQFDKSILEEDRKEVIKTLIFHHEQNYKSRIKKLKRYYEGKHDAIVSKKSDKFKPNNRVINPFPALIVNTVQGYLLGQPVKYISENKELLEQVLDIYYSNDINMKQPINKADDIYIGNHDDNEIDFVIKNNEGIKYIQVALSVRDEKTLERELNPLKNINDNYPKYIITLDYDNVDYDGIKQINAVDFLTDKAKI